MPGRVRATFSKHEANACSSSSSPPTFLPHFYRSAEAVLLASTKNLKSHFGCQHNTAITAMRRLGCEGLMSRNSKPVKQICAFAKGGEEIVIRDRNLPVAKLVPFSEEPSEEELLLVASGKMRLPKSPFKVEELLKIPTGKVSGGQAVQALLDDRAEGL